MSKLYYEALSKIPKRFIDDETQHCVGIDNKSVFIANPKYAPMIYKKNNWQRIRLKSAPHGYPKLLELRYPINQKIRRC